MTLDKEIETIDNAVSLELAEITDVEYSKTDIKISIWNRAD